MNRLIRFLKDWTLPVGMMCGVLGFLAFHYIRQLDPIKPAAQQTAEFLMPTVLFIMLFATFCKVNSSTPSATTGHLTTRNTIADVLGFRGFCAVHSSVGMGL